MEPTAKTSLPLEGFAAPGGKPEEKTDKTDNVEKDTTKRSGRDKSRRGGGPSNAEYFQLPPPPARICPNPKLEICLKCIRCYGMSFLLAFKIYGGLLIIEGLGRMIFNIFQATTTVIDDDLYENKNLVLYYPKLVDNATLDFYILEKHEALFEPFWTSLGASLELIELLMKKSVMVMGNPMAKSQRYLFFIGIPEKLLLDIIPGLLFLLVSLSIIKGAKVKLVCTISTALLGLGALVLLIQICAIIYLIVGSIFMHPTYKALNEKCKDVKDRTSVEVSNGDDPEPTIVKVDPEGCKLLAVMYIPLIGCLLLLILLLLKIHCTKASCALMRNTMLKMGTVGPAPMMPTASTSTSKKPEPEPGGNLPEESNHEVVPSAEVKEEPVVVKAADEEESEGKKKKKEKKSKKTKGSKKKNSKGSNKKSKRSKKKSK